MPHIKIGLREKIINDRQRSAKSKGKITGNDMFNINIKERKKVLTRFASFAAMIAVMMTFWGSFYGITASADVAVCSVNAFSGVESSAQASYDTDRVNTLKPITGNKDAGRANAQKYRGTEVYVGGIPFGIKFTTEGAVVVGFCDVESGGKKVNPAMGAGVQLKDVIVGVNGQEINGAEELMGAVEKCGGKTITLNIKRCGEAVNIDVTPVLSDSEGKFKTGIWVKDNGAGIGTVTFVMENGVFGGLGHGICDGDTGELVVMRSGMITDVTVSGIVKGASGAPGEIKGYFTSGKTGTLLGNTDCGVYGMFVTKPDTVTKKIKIGMRDEIHEGDATVLCTLDDNTCGEYKIKITGIDTKENGNKCFCIHVTDPTLVERTGGIVQGMSGSPIIQDGKLVGAVTHVLINDPTSGYGIFAENMLAQMPDLVG